MFRQLYPVTERSPLGIFLAGLIGGASVAFIIIVFQPFGTSEANFSNKTLFLAGYGLITSVCFWLVSLVSAHLFKAENWTVGKQLITMTLAVLLGITASYFYLLLLGGSPSWHSYGVFVGNAMAIAVLPVVAFTLADFTLKFRKYDQGAQNYNKGFSTKRKDPVAELAAQLIITDEQDRPVLSLPTNQIWCLRSDRNYVDVFHLDENGQQRKTTVRNTLTNLAKELPGSFLRCHRSYVVSADKVKSVSGNAQGYRLHNPSFPDDPVPVSRSKSSQILGFIRG